MTTAVCEEVVMTAGKGPKTVPVRMTEEAIRWARIASGYTGESMSEYVSRTIVEQGRKDADRLHADSANLPPRKKGGSK